MVINNYVKKWCEENYDTKDESFYVENAYYVAKRSWAVGGLKHGIFVLIFGVLSLLFNNDHDVWQKILSVFVNMGILTSCFCLFGMKEYNENDIKISVPCYIVFAILLFIAKGKVENLVKIIFSVITFCAYIYVSFVLPIKFRSVKKNMKQKILEMDEEENASSKRNYYKWRSEYESRRYGLPPVDIDYNDPIMIEAKKLFEGAFDNKKALKKRYRELVKQYHPDHGGDTKLFQCIVAVYEKADDGMSK